MVSTISKYDAVTLSDNNRYVVTHIIEEKGIRYLCMVGNNNSRIMIGREIVRNEEIEIVTLDDPKEISRILKRLFSNF